MRRVVAPRLPISCLSLGLLAVGTLTMAPTQSDDNDGIRLTGSGVHLLEHLLLRPATFNRLRLSG